MLSARGTNVALKPLIEAIRLGPARQAINGLIIRICACLAIGRPRVVWHFWGRRRNMSGRDPATRRRLAFPSRPRRAPADGLVPEDPPVTPLFARMLSL